MLTTPHWKLAVTFAIGVLAGGACRLGYVRVLRATIRSYEYYIQSRIDEQLGQLLG